MTKQTWALIITFEASPGHGWDNTCVIEYYPTREEARNRKYEILNELYFGYGLPHLCMPFIVVHLVTETSAGSNILPACEKAFRAYWNSVIRGGINDSLGTDPRVS